ncbi:amidohydrolase family protein [Pseudomonas rustica]|uniref:amidohydrolase family protein n=1 Tax=Pseudomonas rustica TaxID=2827099 RepID=UPI003CEB5E6D
MNQPYNGPIVDCHIHLFDPNRAEGIPWPVPGDSIYSPHLPVDYWQTSALHGITSAIAVEASPWVSDNRWLLDTVRHDPRMLGFVGNLDPAAKDFGQELEWLAAAPKFLGLRYGNLWDRDLLLDQDKPGFIDNLAILADSGRSLDSANPDTRLLEGLLRLSDKLPQLRIIVDHLPNAHVPPGEEQAFAHQVRILAERPNVFAKLAEIPQKNERGVVFEAEFYRDRLGLLWEAFGEDRCFFGSDWPNSEQLANFSDTLGLVRACLANYSLKAQEKFFYRNSALAYGISLAAD